MLEVEEGAARAMTRPTRLAILALAVGLAVLGYVFPLPEISEPGRRLTAVMLLVATLWVSEALPLAVTALLGPALAVLIGVAPAEQAFAGFGNPIIILFIGSFLLARVTFKHRLNERIAYRVLSLSILGNDPTRAFVFLGLTTAALSAWMSNVAVTAMMLPIAQSVLLAMSGGARQAPGTYAAAFILIVTYAASIGGLFTPVGTPPNLIGIGLIAQATGYRIGFDEWIVKVLPVTLLILVAMTVYLAVVFRHEKQALVYDRAQMLARYLALGAWRPVERRIAVALVTTAAFWLGPPVIGLAMPELGAWLTRHLAEAVAPVLVAGVLFWVSEGDGSPRPIMDLDDLAGIDWPVVVLFGGGMCLGQLMMQTGMAQALGALLAQFLPSHNGPALVFLFALLAVVVSETTSNTASANMVVPVVLAVSTQVGGDPIALGLAATVACTFGFMLPVSTPTNAMAYSTGYITQPQMIRYGIVLDVLGITLLSVWFGYVVR
ncbi:MAG: SLC13 family permease [Deltaproteobacteria bacterium]|nr:SLC13 family permease [Deltaproteobacteria bacterium]